MSFPALGLDVGFGPKSRLRAATVAPILVNKLAGGYLVRDGNHHVEAARRVGLARAGAVCS